MPVVDYTVVNGEILSENRAGTKRDYLPEALGSTIALLDNSQSLTDTFNYWRYGEEKNRTGTNPTAFRYGGTRGDYSDSNVLVHLQPQELNTKLARVLNGAL